MSRCKFCGEDIEFRYVDGVCTPIHVNGNYCGGGGSFVSAATHRHEVIFTYHSSMRDLAHELGHSLLFPTLCRHCGKEIYLFASAADGFAIFDDIGKPWPKHLCGLIGPGTRGYALIDPNFSKRHRLPIPSDTAVGQLQPRQRIRGSVVSVESSGMEVYDGRARYRATPLGRVALGQFIEGVVELNRGQLAIRPNVVQPPSAQEVASSEKAARASEGPPIDVAIHNAAVKTVGSILRARKRAVWVVLSNTNQQIGVFEYSQKVEAESYAAKLSAERRATYYVQKLLDFMD